MQRAAAGWVAQVAHKLDTLALHQLSGSYHGQADAAGVRQTQQLNTTPCAHTFFTNAAAAGIVLYEPFGGLCAGLEMALRNGLTIKQYIYGDTDPVAQQVALHRIRQLQTMYPLQFPEEAVAGAFSLLPMDISQVSSLKLRAAVEAAPVAQSLSHGGWWWLDGPVKTSQLQVLHWGCGATGLNCCLSW